MIQSADITARHVQQHLICARVQSLSSENRCLMLVGRVLPKWLPMRVLAAVQLHWPVCWPRITSNRVQITDFFNLILFVGRPR